MRLIAAAREGVADARSSAANRNRTRAWLFMTFPRASLAEFRFRAPGYSYPASSEPSTPPEPSLDGEQRSLSAVFEFELGEDGADVTLHRAFGEVQLVADLSIAH